MMRAAQMSATLHIDLSALDHLSEGCERLPRDEYLRDGGRYRSRRHSCFTEDFNGSGQLTGSAARPPGGNLVQVPHRAHWQPTSYNALHGELERWFEPIAPELLKD